jgi:putative Mg2+ transporter-C (MgtC) family protein
VFEIESLRTPASLFDVAGRLAIAALLGGAIGLNRELHQKPAGVRTHAIVAMGAALLSLVSTLSITPAGDASGVSRVIQGIVAGIGFLGGGVILRREQSNQIQGLTTAATIWLVAAVGVAAGVGLWRTALIAIVLSLLVLTLGRRFEKLF